MSANQELTPLRYDQTGLRGRLARVLVEQPTDEIDWPADLPAGIDTVVILDDEPNPHHTLRVHPLDDPTNIALVVFDQLALCADQRQMDPRRIELNRRHSREMGLLFHRFLDAHPDVESEVAGAQMTAAQDAAWTAYSAALLARHQAERSALADEIEAGQRQRDGQ
ncbi:hypothetical protein OHA40_29300 [Nocardia sp. NBC_00508]|uniref:DUF7161 family protein n=1 Tax=Nocardia sp. NBC_00508 TaxID=2975992 RepID=UPI002E816CED|nr:hypothetical protein [Nocardia sp. NBC_00508]WUD65671.1 hypothetical protein OHA40_29300 [Nocardia sp. NBC_00508]